jgi:hypothetical protein
MEPIEGIDSACVWFWGFKENGPMRTKARYMTNCLWKELDLLYDLFGFFIEINSFIQSFCTPVHSPANVLYW